MYLDMINVVPIAGAYPSGGPFGACAPPPPNEPNAKRKSLRKLDNVLDVTNELIRKILSQ